MSLCYKHSCCFLSVLFLLAGTTLNVHAQKTYQKGEKAAPGRVRRALTNLYDQSLNSLKKDPLSDSIGKANQQVNARKSEQALEPYEGKIIRKIYVKSVGFEFNFNDTGNKIVYWGTRLLNNLHTNTKEWVIRNNLFIKPNDQFSAYKVSDNERYIRSYGFIQDVRISVLPLAGSSDSIDLLVLTKDLFSLSGILDADRTTAKFRISEGNLMGMGQGLQATVLYDLNRMPKTGYEFRYSKYNIGGSFINADMGYSQINNGVHVGIEQEEASYLRLNKPLVSPYSHSVGGAEISSNQSVNSYGKANSLFYDYHYNYYNAWAGYNVASFRFLEKYTKMRKREFFALRYMNTHFSRKPLQVADRFDPLYNDKEAVLGSFTFFREDFYKTNYIYGFGTTEDVPVGYNINVTGGWYRQNKLERPYAGVNLTFFQANPSGYFAQYYLKTGTFLSRGALQDVTFLAGVDVYSPLINCNRGTKLRQFVRVSYSRIINRLTYAPLNVGNSFGLRDFDSDSLWGQERINLNTDLVLYTNIKLFGFRLAPFLYSDIALLRPDSAGLRKVNLYTGIGGGLRVRNSNFVFGTIEARCIYFPVTKTGGSGFKINVSSELYYRYRTDYVRMPDIIQLNESLY